jgi:hypothetical protein
VVKPDLLDLKVHVDYKAFLVRMAVKVNLVAQVSADVLVHAVHVAHVVHAVLPVHVAHVVLVFAQL